MTDRYTNDLYGDWALFQLIEAPRGMKPAKLRKKAAIIGEPIHIFAAPSGDPAIMTSGRVSGVEEDGPTNLIRTDAYVYFGSSGGGLYDRKGRLIGVVVALRAVRGHPLPHANYAVPVVRILEYLKY
jgi:S1-C subfamily serine protease